jgi:hypothetical protein
MWAGPCTVPWQHCLLHLCPQQVKPQRLYVATALHSEAPHLRGPYAWLAGALRMHGLLTCAVGLAAEGVHSTAHADDPAAGWAKHCVTHVPRRRAFSVCMH